MWGFALADYSEVQAGLDLLSHDLELGRWENRNGHLRTKESYDLGFIFVKIMPNQARPSITRTSRYLAGGIW